MVWSLADYCATQQPLDLSSLIDSSRSFVESLDLPSVHPFCNDDAGPFPMEGVPPMGRMEHRFEDESTLEMLITMWYMVAPPLLAMAELWLRLFAGALGPLGILYLLVDEWKWKQQQQRCLIDDQQQLAGERSVL